MIHQRHRGYMKGTRGRDMRFASEVLGSEARLQHCWGTSDDLFPATEQEEVMIVQHHRGFKREHEVCQ